MTFQDPNVLPPRPSSLAEFALLPPRPTPPWTARAAAPAAATKTAAAPVATLLATRGEDVLFHPTRWVWPGRVACAKLTLIGGAPGIGKSTLAIDLAAAVTTGDDWPCGEGTAPQGTVMLVCPDGDIDTIGPRLVAAGVELARIHIIREVAEPGGPRPFDVGKDLAVLKTAALAIKDLQLIIFDALPIATGRSAASKNQALLKSLAELANSCRAAVVAVAPLPGAGHPSRRLASLATLPLSAARTAFLIETDPADEHRRLILQVKNELAADPGTLAFRLADEPDEIAARVRFEPQHTGVSPAAFSARQSRGFNSAKAEAIEFLRGLFDKTSQLPVRTIEDEARGAGLLKTSQALSQCRALRDARLALGFTAARAGFGKDGAWLWVKPGVQVETNGPAPVAQRPKGPQDTAPQPATTEHESATQACGEQPAPAQPAPSANVLREPLHEGS